MEQLFQYLYQEDTLHVNLLCEAFRRFTPATLLYMHRKGVGKFLEEMAAECITLGGKYSAEADLRAAHALPFGKYLLYPSYQYFMTRICWTVADMKVQFVQPSKANGKSSITLYTSEKRVWFFFEGPHGLKDGFLSG